jgi:hypothetical protein
MALFLLVALACQQLPTYGELSDLQGLSKVYVVADPDARKLIIEELKKSSLQVMADPKEAEFIIECERKEPVVTMYTQHLSYEMTVLTIREEKRRIAWSKLKSSLRPPAKLLTRDFLKDLKKLKDDPPK